MKTKGTHHVVWQKFTKLHGTTSQQRWQRIKNGKMVESPLALIFQLHFIKTGQLVSKMFRFVPESGGG
jgi:hypothetical protein